MVAPASSSFVRLTGVGKAFGGGAAILKGVDLDVAVGEFVSFVGPSGCGKSTLLRLLAGLLEPSSGTIRIGGEAPSEARRSMGFVFQEPTLLPWRCAAENVELPLLLRGEPEIVRRRRAASLLRLMGIESAAGLYPWQLSGGMKMRVSIARALSTTPQVLLLDEPFGALDEMTRDRLNEEILGLRERDPFTAFFVTHSVAEAVFLSTRIAVLAQGRISRVFDSPFGYPRTPELRESPAYLKHLSEVSRALRESAGTVWVRQP